MNIPKISALFETSLASAMTAAATSFSVVSGTDRDGNALSGLYGFIVDEGTADEEFIVGTISSTTVTVVYRGIDADDPVTEVSGNKKAHRRGASVKITDYPILGYLRNMLAGESGYTLPALLKYATGIVPVSADDLVDKAYVDALLAGVVTTVNVIVPGTAGETVSAGNLIYFDDTDNEWKKCDADTAATVENTMLGIAQGAGTDGGAINGGVLVRGLDANQSGLTAGAIYYASNTAGAISASAGTKEVTIGFSYSTTQLYFNPRFNQQITEDEQDALVGTSGTPSNSNKFVTADDVAENTASKIVRRKSNSNITVPATPTDTTDAASKSYVDAIAVGEKISIVTTDVTIASSAAETNLISVAIPANTLGTANGVKAKLFISNLRSQNGTETLILKFKYGATTLVTSATLAVTATSTSLKGWIEVVLLAAGATNSQEGSMQGFFAAEGNGDALNMWHDHGVGTAAEDSTGALNLVVTAQFSSNGANDTLTMSHAIIEKIR
jgi:hypothetical protein